MPHDDFAKGWEGWIRRYVQHELDKVMEEIADVVGKNIIRERKRADARIAESEAAALELVGALERKIVDLERRAMLKPTRPHLVSGDPDAA